MKNDFDRIRIWTQQRNITVPNLFFQHYKELNIQDDEALIVMHLLSFEQEGIDFPTPNDLMMRTHFQISKISQILQRLMQRGMLEISQSTDDTGKIAEKYSLFPLWERIIENLETQQQKVVETANKVDEATIFTLFEQEFGRLLSPIELETIGMWIDIDKHSPNIIKAALKEAVLASKVSLRYIDRILMEWKKKNITTLGQVEKHSEQYRKHTTTTNTYQPPEQHQQPSKRVSFYNWLEERE